MCETPDAMTARNPLPSCLSHLEQRDAAVRLRALEEAGAERDKAQSACTAWQFVFEGIEAHLLDRIAMGDPASPETYLRIIRADVADIQRESDAIVKSRWADSARHQKRIQELEAELAALRAPATDEEVVEIAAIAILVAWEEAPLEWAKTTWAKWKAHPVECQHHMDVYLSLVNAMLPAVAPKLRTAALDDARLACIGVALGYGDYAGRHTEVTAKCAATNAEIAALDCVAAIRRMMEAGPSQ